MKNINEIYSKIHNNRRKILITVMKYLNEFRAHISFFYKSAHKSFRNVIKFVCLHLYAGYRFKKIWVKYFFCTHNLQVRAIYTFASTNILSKRELLIMSANFLALYCSSIRDILLYNCHGFMDTYSVSNWHTILNFNS